MFDIDIDKKLSSNNYQFKSFISDLVLEKVEKMEESRINKQVSFEDGKLSWRQKLRTIFALERETSKSASIDDENLSGKFDDNGIDEDQRELIRIKEEERKAIEEKKMKEVAITFDNAKIDSTAFNVISDHISILMGFETEKDRKKREKNEKKQKQKEQKLEKKQKELKEKLQKKEREKNEKFEKKKEKN